VENGLREVKQRSDYGGARSSGERVNINTGIQGVPEKNVQSLMHHNFATLSHRVQWFSPECSESNR